MSKWYEKRGIDDDVVLTSRVTLSRNLYDFPFAPKLTDSESLQLIETVAGAFFSDDGSASNLYKFVRLDTLRRQRRAYWAEHQVTDASATDPKMPQALIVSANESASIWINGDNHIQIRAVLRGRQIGKAYEMARFLDDWLSKHLTYAYSKKYGHLTTSTGDIGTGMHVAYLMRLPMTQRAGLVNAVSERLAKDGFSISKKESFGTREAGAVYAISNKKTLGVTEADILDKADDFAQHLVTQERELHSAYLSADRVTFEDKAYKAYGMFKYAKKLTMQEAMTQLYFIEQGILDKNIVLSKKIDIFPLMIEIQSESLSNVLDYCFEKHDEERYRAMYIQQKLPSLQNAPERD